MNQKDIQKTDINSYGHISNMLADKGVYDFATKKTEKLVTALYMVTDCMDTDDALKSKLRLLGVELLSDIFKFTALSPLEKYSQADVSLSRIKEIISFIEIAGTIGFISEMNTSILNKEFAILSGELEQYKSKDKHFTFTLDENMFEVKRGDNNINGSNVLNKENNSIKDIYPKRTPLNNMSFINNKSPLENFTHKRLSNRVNDLADREDRTNKIIAIIKDMSSKTNGDGVSIKDISLSFKDYSEKTIQRELNSLVSKGKLKKTGSKRWSRYSIITNQ